MDTSDSSGRSRSTTDLGDDFEAIVCAAIERDINSNRFFLSADRCRIFRKKGYHSRDRQGDIKFDIAIEVWEADADSYSMVVLVECKGLGRSVSVDDAEEFFAKMQQVAAANGKGIIASPVGFQRGTVEYARAKGIGLLRYIGDAEIKWELRRAPTLFRDTPWEFENEVLAGLQAATDEKNFRRMYCFGPCSAGFSVGELIVDLTRGAVSDANLDGSSTPNVTDRSTVPFLSIDDIEKQAFDVLRSAAYECGPAPLEHICDDLRRSANLDVMFEEPGDKERRANVLGRIRFGARPTIHVYAHPEQKPTRQRFTLAHELGHYLLGHGEYLESEYCDETDVGGRGEDVSDGDVRRLEWQANRFASCLLMPRSCVEWDFQEIAVRFDLRDRGHGRLYVDHQPVNLQAYGIVTSILKSKYNVSRKVVEIRLKSMGILNDARGGQERSR